MCLPVRWHVFVAITIDSAGEEASVNVIYQRNSMRFIAIILGKDTVTNGLQKRGLRRREKANWRNVFYAIKYDLASFFSQNCF